MTISGKKTGNRLLLKRKTPFQTIELRQQDGGLLLALNGSPQVFSREEREYHELIATLPMMLAAKAERVAILGGGDGLAARNVLQFSDPKRVTLVELDAAMIELWSNRAELKAMNEGALKSRRLELVVADAVEWFLQSNETFDVIICDIELEYTRQPDNSSLQKYYRFFQAIGEKLNRGGVWSTTVADDDDTLLLDGLFEIGGDTLPSAIRKKYSRLKGPVDKSRCVLSALYPCVKECTANFSVLGTHTTFYISKDERIQAHRKPAASSKYLSRALLTKLLR